MTDHAFVKRHQQSGAVWHTIGFVRHRVRLLCHHRASPESQLVFAALPAFGGDVGRSGLGFRHHHFFHDDQVSRLADSILFLRVAVDVCHTYCLSFESGGGETKIRYRLVNPHVPQSCDPCHRNLQAWCLKRRRVYRLGLVGL